ncbi:kinase-like protein [Phanerochaete sordida]|uniref:non-specific serine/threonine protein kinase n=1 Tax=Phanerochaete sordida TaxID=48140 RepID=A0A9P3G7W7_9APHY|nr:kinase-like protein [Phanerochaete sordida]
MFERSDPLTIYMHIAQRAALLKIFSESQVGRTALRKARPAQTATGVPEWVLREEPVHKYFTTDGYWPVQEDTRLGGYLVRRKLGWGPNSTVWLALYRHGSSLTALKVMTGAATKHLAGLPDALRRMRIQSPTHPGHAHVARVLDHFYHPSFNKNHMCVAMEPLSEDLQTFSARWPGPGGLPSGLARRVVRQVVQALDFLHTECRVVHAAIAPEHIMLASVPPADIRPAIAIADRAPTWRTTVPPDGVRLALTPSLPLPVALPSGGATSLDAWRHVSVKLLPDLYSLARTRKSRARAAAALRLPHLCAPEVCLGASGGTPADVWSIGCLAFELAMGHPLLSRDIASEHVPRALAAHFGELPHPLGKRGKYRQPYLNDNGSMKGSKVEPISVAEVVGRAPPADAGLLIDFLNHVFILDPSQRPSARELLKHKWLQP